LLLTYTDSASNSDRLGRPLFEARRISKSFPGVIALRGVDLTCRAGSVHALIGGNGAGKSTLVSIITGIAQPDSGELFLDGVRFQPRSPREALKAGVVAVYQELAVLPNLSALDNIALGQEITRRVGWLDRRKERDRIWEALEALGAEELNLDAESEELSVAQLQIVEIARSLVHKARVLVLDEPSAVLAGRELNNLFSVVRALAAQGVAVLYISHRLSDITELCDEITVLRDGRLVSNGPASEYDTNRIIEDMVGHKLSAGAAASEGKIGPIVLEVDKLMLPGTEPTGINLQVHAGEVVGLAGLMGSGRSRILRSIAGLEHPGSGSVKVKGKELRRSSIRSAIRHGVALIPEERKTQGLVLDMSLAHNITLGILRRVARLGILLRPAEKAAVDNGTSRLAIQSPNTRQKVRNLSGGTQQKVVLAKWLATEPAVLLLDEPTRGIDVGTKTELYRIIQALAETGIATVLVSSDLPELLALSNRVLVLSGGRIVAELAGGDASEDSVLEIVVRHEQGAAS
jgi:ABC-type sugar transport system ATPase subunit